jgi:hypothetical protein
MPLTEGGLMRRLSRARSGAPVLALAAALLLGAGCGNESQPKDPAEADDAPTATPSTDTAAGEGDWLLGVTSAGGADGEKSTTVYVTYNPSTGKATASKMPGVVASSTTPAQASLLVSSDRRWAIPDTAVPGAQGKSGQLKVYSPTTGTAKVIDLHRLAGDDGVEAVGWAFDPQRPDTLRVVDTKNRIWAVSVAGGTATKEGSLSGGGPWTFTNGFNPNTGEPWLESIDSDATKPAGNGAADTSPVSRSGGTVLASESEGLTKLPQSPCRLAGAFTTSDGVTWAFCADKPTLSTYYLPKGGEKWVAYGKPSTAVAPVASGVPLVLPPAA